MKGYFAAKKSFVVEVTFNDLLVEVMLKTFYPVFVFFRVVINRALTYTHRLTHT